MSDDRITLRLVCRDKYARVTDVVEQSIPATAHQVELFLRRAPFRSRIAETMMQDGSVTIERKGKP